MSHVGDRILVSGSTEGTYHCSIHDSGWFDFLCMDAGFSEETIKNCANAYWNGDKIIESKLELYGKPWSQPPTPEVLFYGNLKISEKSRLELRELLQKEYQREPWKYPYMQI